VWLPARRPELKVYRAKGRNEQGKVVEQGKVIEQGEVMMRPQIFVFLSEIILDGKPPATLLALSSGLIGIYLRFYQFTFAVMRLMQ
jgi:hypothetical protein